jgi:hypothetical protein
VVDGDHLQCLRVSESPTPIALELHHIALQHNQVLVLSLLSRDLEVQVKNWRRASTSIVVYLKEMVSPTVEFSFRTYWKSFNLNALSPK